MNYSNLVLMLLRTMLHLFDTIAEAELTTCIKNSETPPELVPLNNFTLIWLVDTELDLEAFKLLMLQLSLPVNAEDLMLKNSTILESNSLFLIEFKELP